jgi:phage-related protein
MGGGRRIVIEFLGKDVSAGRTANQVEGKMSRLGGTFSKVGKVAALGLAAGTVVAGKALFDMTKAASEDAQQQAILAKALQNNAGATKGQIAATEDWIAAQGKALGVTDDQLRPALANLVRATGDVGKAQKLASLGMDVAAGSGKDLGAVSIALAKAANGNVGALGRLGIATKDAHGKTKSFAQIQDDLAKKFGGSAKANADTFSGKMSRLKLIFDEAKESLGAKLLPVLTDMADWFISKGLPAIQDFGDWMRDHLGPVFDQIGTVVSKVTGGMNGDVGKNLGAIRSTFQSVASIITSLWNAFGATILKFATVTLVNLWHEISGVLQIISGVFKVFSSLLKGDWRGVWTGIKQILSGALTVIKALLSQALNIIKSLWRVAWIAVKAILGGVWDGIKGLVRAGADGIVNAIKAIPGRVKALAGVFKDAGKHLIQSMVDGLKNAAGIISGIAGNVWTAVKSLLNAGIDKINAALEFKISLPGPDIHVNPTNIPHLATGGIVKARRGGVLALLGEGGHDEAVVPLSGPNKPKSGGGDLMIAAPLNINMDGRNVWKGLLTVKRQNGGVALGLA